jgi:hypothetical protein
MSHPRDGAAWSQQSPTLADVEILTGGNVRIVFFTWERDQRVIVTKIITSELICSDLA